MGYWGWRPLVAFVFISVWIVGCTTKPDLTPDTDSTDYPVTPFTAYSPPRIQHTPSHFSPLYVTFMPQYENSMGVLITPVLATPEDEASVTLSPLLCYETTTNRAICYGQIQNMTDTPLHQVVVDFDDIQGPQQLVLYQKVLLPDEQAPVHFWLSTLPTFEQLRIGTMATESYEQPLTVLQVSDVVTEQDEMVYQVNATITHDGEEGLDWAQAMMTVFNAQDQVVGYRIVNMSGFQPGESHSLEIRIVPHDVATYDVLQVIGGNNPP